MLKAEGLMGEAILHTFLARRILPIRARDHTMWLYSGPDDPMQESPLELLEVELSQRSQDIIEAGGTEYAGPQPLPLAADWPSTRVRSSSPVLMVLLGLSVFRCVLMTTALRLGLDGSVSLPKMP